MEAVLISIPHTGTWFTLKLFTDQKVREVPLNHRREDNQIYHGHLLKPSQIYQAFRLSADMPLIIPMRHPYAVEQSWISRGKDTAELFRAFDTLLEMYQSAEPYILPIDSPMCEYALDEVSEAVGIRLETDWSVIHSIGEYRKTEPSEQMREVVKTMKPFLTDIGYG